MLIAENIKQHLAEATISGRRYYEEHPECRIHHEVAELIPDDIDVDNLIIAYKICLDNYEKHQGNVLPFIATIPQYVRKGTTQEFAKEFRKKYITDILGLPPQPELETDYGYVETEPDVIDISNKNKYAVLAALYNYSTPYGMGFAQYDPYAWDEEIGKLAFEKFGEVLADGSIFFGWVQGRLMRCKFKDNLVYVEAYNRENIDGLGQLAVSSVPNLNQKEKPIQKVKKD